MDFCGVALFEFDLRLGMVQVAHAPRSDRLEALLAVVPTAILFPRRDGAASVVPQMMYGRCSLL